MSVRRSRKSGFSVFVVLLLLIMCLGLAAVASAQPTIASVSSSTHPDETTYYANSAPAFSWTVGDPGTGICGYWYESDKQQTLDSYTLANPWIVDRFGDPVTTSAPGESTNVGVGDLNGDGKQDVVVAETNGKVDVMLGDGSGGFTLKSTVDTTQPMTRAVVVADFNHDSHMDVAATTAPNELAVMLGDGSGNLGAPQLSPGRSAQSIVAADFDNDGWPDLATDDGATVSVFMNSQNPGALFPTCTDVATTTSSGGPSLAVGKIDGDSNLDLVANNFNSSVEVLLGDGLGGFTRKTPDPATLDGYPTSVAIADFDGNGKADVFVTYNQAFATASILPGNGDGTFGARKDITNGSFGYGGDLASTVGDFNNDGKADLAVVAKPYNVGDNFGLYVLLGHGDFTFADSHNWQVIPAAHPVWPLVADDFTGDGHVDLLTRVDNSSDVNVYPNTTLTPTASTTGPPLADGLWYFHVRAVDKDGNWSDPITRAVRVGAGPILASVDSASLDTTGWSTTLDPTFTWTPDDPLTWGYSWSFSTNQAESPADGGLGLPLTTAGVHATDDGTWYFKVNACDATGHWGTVSEVQVPVDTHAPSLSLFDASSTWPGTSFLADNATYSQGDEVFAAFDSQDGGSGPNWSALTGELTAPDNTVSDLDFEWAQYGEDQGPPLRAVLDTSQPGTYTLTSTIADVAGNPTTLTVHYKVASGGTLPPTTTLDPSSHPEEWKSTVGSDILRLNADASPGDTLATMSYAWDADSPTVITCNTTSWLQTIAGYVDKTGHTFDGVHVLSFHSTGVLGGAEASQSAPIGVDTIAPVTVGSGSDALWHNAPVPLTFTTNEQNWASGSASGLGRWNVTLDNVSVQNVGYPTATGQIPGAPLLPQGPQTATENYTVLAPSDHSNDGVHTVNFWANDAASNFGNYGAMTVKIDTTGPSQPTVSGGSATWFNTDRTLTASGSTDAGSGIAGYQYSTDGGATWNAMSGNAVTFTGNMNATVQIHAIDSIGNVGPASAGATVRIDKTPPTQPTVSGGSTTWFNTDRTLTASSSDAGSGIAGYQYSTDGGATWNAMTGNAVTFTNNINATVVIRAMDAAGNPSAASTAATVKIDKTPPAVTITKPLAGDYYPRTPTVASAGTVTDAASGMASQVVTIDGAAATLGGPLNMSVGTHTFRVVATDNAGNVTTVSVPYRVSNTADTTPPTVTITNAEFYDGQSYPANQPLSIDFTATDSTAGTSLARWSVSVTGPNGPVTIPQLTAVGTSGATTGIVPALTSTTGAYVATIKATDGANNTTSVVVHYNVTGDWGQGLLTQVNGVWTPSPVGNPLPVTVTSGSVVPFEFKLGGDIASVLGGSAALSDLKPRLYIVDPATNKLVYKAPGYFTWSAADQAWKYNLNVSAIWSQIPCGSKGRVLRHIIVFCDPQGAPKFTSGCGCNSTISDLTPVSSDAGVISKAAASTSASTDAAASAAAQPVSSSPAAIQALAAVASPKITGLAPTSTSLTSGVATVQVTGSNFGSSATGNYVQVSGYSGATHTTSWSQRATISAWSASKIVFKTPANYTGTFNLQVFVGTTGSNVWSSPALTIAAATGSTDIRYIRGS